MFIVSFANARHSIHVKRGIFKNRKVYLNVYCPECPPRGAIVYQGGQQKKILPFGHRRDLVAFSSTGL